MTDDDGPAPSRAEPTATDLLEDMRTLRARVRADRHGYAFPLFLFGGLILLAPLTYVSIPGLPIVNSTDGTSGFQLVDQGPFPQFAPMFGNVKYPGLVDWYWVLTIVGGTAITGWWYRRRARRLGIETDTRWTFVAALAVLAGFLLWQPVLEQLAANVGRGINLYSAPWLNLPILFGSAVLATAVLAWTFRPQRTDRQRAAGVFVGVLLASLTFATVGVYMIKGFSALLAIAVALLVLAWWERSIPLAVIGTLFTIASIPANHWLWDWDLDELYQWLGWASGRDDAQVYAVQSLLLPGLILVVGGAVTALTRARNTP
ncbi:hypothetical protein [Actinophytocola sp.]|uniref:hypothetical protein n=1 Tax=Actinophytocola sp. TaxID=1872138 RepID=UPI003D6BA5DF